MLSDGWLVDLGGLFALVDPLLLPWVLTGCWVDHRGRGRGVARVDSSGSPPAPTLSAGAAAAATEPLDSLVESLLDPKVNKSLIS